MPFDALIAATRFGTGLSPRMAPLRDSTAMLDLLLGPDGAAADWPIPGMAGAAPDVAQFFEVNRLRRLERGTPRGDELDAIFRAMTEGARAAQRDHLARTLARWVTSADGLRERLVAFWADHFTVRSRLGQTVHLVAPYVQDAIRPHVAGRFADLLRAATTHPMMVLYLDQNRSAGPGSPQAGHGRGLNENLAREVLELHTLGVGGPYSQADVRELAELLTGLTYAPDRGTLFRPGMAEPGAETVLGRTFGPVDGLDNIGAALDMLATHPATAAHIARKLAVHFVADDPDPGLVAALEQAFASTGGDLAAVAAVLLDHPASWTQARAKVLPPFDYLGAALRALDVDPQGLTGLDGPGMNRLILRPLQAMGQPWQAPGGPDGWPEAPADWITPNFMAARIDWALRAPSALLTALPDPRNFAATALGRVPEAVEFAASAAEDRAAGVALVLSSPAFQRR